MCDTPEYKHTKNNTLYTVGQPLTNLAKIQHFSKYKLVIMSYLQTDGRDERYTAF